MKITTKHSLIALTCALALSPSLMKADKGNTSSAGGGMLIQALSDDCYSSRPAVSVTNFGSSIVTGFNLNLGNVIVDVEDENGFIVYSESVNTSSVSQLTINTANLTFGAYVIKVTNAQGGVVAEDTFWVE